MSKRFKRDRIENENYDASELSSTRFVIVPLMMLSALLGFGITYLVLETPDMQLAGGDSRIRDEVGNMEKQSEYATGPSPIETLSGQTLYAANCQSCHQVNGAGIPGAFPPLVGSEWVLENEKRLINIVLHGLHGEITVNGNKFNGVMPAFKDSASDAEIAAILSYIRNSWSNNAEAISSEVVGEVREATKERTSSWNGAAELSTLDEN